MLGEGFSDHMSLGFLHTIHGIGDMLCRWTGRFAGVLEYSNSKANFAIQLTGMDMHVPKVWGYVPWATGEGW
jgi:hypothetical protein